MQPSPASPRTPVWLVVLAVLTGLWLVGLALLTQLVYYGADTFFLATDGTLTPGWIPFLGAVFAAVFLVTPSALLGWLPRSPGVRATGQTWTWSGLAFVVLSAARLAPSELYLGLLASAALALGTVLRRARQPDLPGAGWTALAAGLVMLAPWAWAGALGGLTETVLAAAAAAGVGFLAGRILSPVRFKGSWPMRVVVGGLVAGVALAVLAAGTGGSGVSVAELAVLPPLGFAVAALRRAGPVVGLAAAGPLAFVDPEETSLLLGTSDVGYWTAIASGLALVLALVVDAVIAATYGRGVPLRKPLAAALPVVLVLGGVYVGLGQPGLHGERLFVVMSAQADLTGVESIVDRGQRLRETYRRLVDTAERTQKSIRRDLNGLRVGFRPYYLVNGLEVDGGPALRAWLARRSDVDRVLLNPVLRPLPAPPEPIRGGPAPRGGWNIEALNAQRAWSEFGGRGAGIVVGSSDSGVDGAHPALAKSFRGGDDSWYDPWNHTRAPTDHSGHGTHTLGSAMGANGIGVAPDAQWVGCVNLDRNLGSPSAYLECLQFMLAPFPRGGDPLRDGRPERAPHILTNSWGCPHIEGCDRRVLRGAVHALTAAGLFFVAAAGNSGPECGSIQDEPAIFAEAFTVGAVDQQMRVPQFSSRGPVPGATEPDVVAPGVDIWSALPGGGYGPLDGTSMAAPHVAGVAALMWSANPKLIGDVTRTAEILRATAQPATARGNACGDPRNLVGAGVVDAYAAVAAARAA